MSLTTVWHFELSGDGCKDLALLSNFEVELMSKLVSVIRLGLHLHGKEISLASSALALEHSEAFIKKAKKSWMDSDKLFPLRRTAPSLSAIMKLIPLDTKVDSMTVFKICIQRTFGVGSEDAIIHLHKSLSSTQSSSSPYFMELITIIGGLGNGATKIVRPVYGQLQITRASVPTMLDKFWYFAKEVSDGDVRTFKEVYNLLCESNIPTVPKSGLLAWLIVSDLTEWNVCAAPDIHDLTMHLGISSDQSHSKRKGTPSGPTKALKLVEDIHKEIVKVDRKVYTKPDVGASLIKVWGLFEHPPTTIPWLGELMQNCRVAQGRPLSVVDMEHLLCKIARYAGKSTEES